MNSVVATIIDFIALFLAVAIVLSLHEFAHAIVAVKCGDPTPKLYHRCTINPLAHFDPLGIVCFVVARFGWAKPVPINPSNFRRFRRDLAFVSVAGIAMNYLTAFVCYPLYLAAWRFLPDMLLFDDLIVQFLYYGFLLSLNFCVFNLLPVYPLDGFRLVDALNRRRGPIYRFLRNYGYYCLLGLVLLSLIAEITGFYYIDVLGYVMTFARSIVGYPIMALWNLIF